MNEPRRPRRGERYEGSDDEMSHWKDAAVTNDGVEMLNEWMAGRKITIVAAYGGAGTVEPELLAEQTGLVDRKQELHILGEENGQDGKTVQLQVNNAGLAEEYELNQVGVYAALDVKDTDTDQEIEARMKLLFLMQDEKGVTIPPETDASFLLELYCAIGITNNGRFEVSVSAAGIVTAAFLRETMEREFAAHNADGKAHPSLRALMDQVSAGSARVEAMVAEVDDRLTLLELMYRTQVSGNPFTVSFDDMSGLTVTGVWNAAQNRVEF